MITDLAILFIFHFIFDGLLQTRKVARNKSSDMKYLLGHITYVMFGILLAGLFFTGMDKNNIFTFAVSNAILHGIIDWNIWNVYKYSVVKRYPDVTDRFEYWNDGWFYHFIMGDQLLHTLCYLATYLILMR